MHPAGIAAAAAQIDLLTHLPHIPADIVGLHAGLATVLATARKSAIAGELMLVKKPLAVAKAPLLAPCVDVFLRSRNASERGEDEFQNF